MFCPTPLPSAVASCGMNGVASRPDVCSRPVVSTRNSPPSGTVSSKPRSSPRARSRVVAVPAVTEATWLGDGGLGMAAGVEGLARQASATVRAWSDTGMTTVARPGCVFSVWPASIGPTPSSVTLSLPPGAISTGTDSVLPAAIVASSGPSASATGAARTTRPVVESAASPASSRNC